MFKSYVVIEGNMPIPTVTLVLQCSVKRKKMNPQMSEPADIDRARFVYLVSILDHYFCMSEG